MAQSTPPLGASFAYESSIESLREQLQRIEALDSKAGITLAASGIFAGLVFRENSVLVRAPRPIGIAATSLLIVAIIAALMSFATRSYGFAPTPAIVLRLQAFSEDWIRWRLLGNVADALTINQSKLHAKAQLLTLAQGLLLAVVGVIGGYLIYASAFSGHGGL